MLLALAAPLLFRTIVGTSVERSVISSAGCGKPLPSCVEAGKSKNLSISSSSGVSPRHYRLAISASYENGDAYDNKTPVPLILSFHGRNKDAKFQEELSQFSNTSAYDFRGIVAYPEGVPVSSSSQILIPRPIDSIQVTLTISPLDLQRHPTMARRPRLPQHLRHHLHHGAPGPSTQHILHRHHPHLRQRQVQRRRLHRPVGMRRNSDREDCCIRSCLRRLLLGP